MNIIDYVLVESNDASLLSDDVTARLKTGWLLYGAPCVSISKGEYRTIYTYCQGMVKQGPAVNMALGEKE